MERRITVWLEDKEKEEEEEEEEKEGECKGGRRGGGGGLEGRVRRGRSWSGGEVERQDLKLPQRPAPLRHMAAHLRIGRRLPRPHEVHTLTSLYGLTGGEERGGVPLSPFARV
ncbi:hypothetical protein E2C01_043880 [Portunus trituberculatus]|uniref:Uncharacterized protein n=1 Tax=Portunus trituberculatus TaxID=210409 RepID=A0A5B7FYW5_PORTR|nr:hypothetical protein [Portunus trituberculatus]